mmetsp:Transcript_5247/g.8655  ORF Transcript_5247/g.8655 Transcript_5247/m.8655 type:complete len:527 (+) Transcript_5247:280-1860(+)|eukprot:CAMPEP_0114424102 /NCGR_PEP_ID=MMETSP0103-20121206/6511_1 /TAXON_ID=37642 ORGANISM="Paraphysomonas imperforata, Strain PA2" /NCGR_SAMPLE_ID=MMETSP0103 /ASSEMBLY_ACC=CAM_ASM_000201 /LENGTH=526 /DNA_ID=CAMNT_0001592825 /DNA_START=46 /DNA_END=1626 /DNA_ORIENTATION=-
MNSVLNSIVSPHNLNSLKPTATVVRAMPIIADAWEDAAIGLQSHDDHHNQRENVSSSFSKPGPEVQTNFMKCLTEVRGTPNVTLSATGSGDRNQQQNNHTEDTGDTEQLTTQRPFPGSSCPTSNNDDNVIEHLKSDYGWSEAHGFRGDPSWEFPVKVKHCEQEARPGYATKLAHEYADTPYVLRLKISLLASLLRASENCLLYTGAGISTASGIGDYATRPGSSSGGSEDTKSKPKLRSPYEAQPTYAHRALVALHEASHVQYWVQQNHDGLPQKAGLPQHCLNEIHGAWYDPSNPVVAMNGNLREDLFADLLAWEQRADLTLALGTSMCGMNSDRVFTTVANKGRQASTKKQYSKSLGGVIINMQQTQFDHLACLRIYADLDVAMGMLLEEMSMADQKAKIDATMSSRNISDHFLQADTQTGSTDTTDVLRVPYDDSGKRSSSQSLLDVRVGSTLRLTGGPYEGDEGEVLGRNREGHLRVQFRHLVGRTRRPFETVLGSWWLQAAVRGEVAQMPIVSVRTTPPSM